MPMYELIFNKDGNGADEIHKLIGMIDADLDFYKWEPWLKLERRKITAIVGKDVYSAALEYYNNGTISGITGQDDLLDIFLKKVQTANILFAWLRIIPTLDAQHGKSGRQKRIGENEKGLTAAEQYKDESNISILAYESLDDLLDFLDENKDYLPFWTNSNVYKEIQKLIIPDLITFDSYYNISSFRLFVTIWAWIKEVQDDDIIPIITQARYDQFKTALNTKPEDRTPYEQKLVDIKDRIYRPAVLLSMIKAFKRLPVQAIPEGLVQVQVIGTVKERLRATESAVKTQIANLTDDANSALVKLQNEIADLNGSGDAYIGHARKIGHGFTF